MANPAAVLLPRAIGQGTTQIFRATVAAPAPTSYADSLYVTVGDWTSQFTLPPISSWDRGSNGGALPSVGDPCLVVRDNVNVPHVVLWDHANATPFVHTYTVDVASVGSPVAAAGGEATVTLTHNLGSTTVRPVHLGFRDGAYTAHLGYRYSVTDANNMAFVYGNNHPTQTAWGYHDIALI